jgi:hypothetical protein
VDLEEVMPPIPPDLLDCVFYLYQTRDHAEKGERTGGTGFFVSKPTETDATFLYAVTNQHVVGGQSQSRVMRVNTPDRPTPFETVETQWSDWIQHEDGLDIAAMSLGLSTDYPLRVSAVPSTTLVANEGFMFGPGDDVCVVGRFITHDGKQRNEPTVRFGHISAMPGEPLKPKRGVAHAAFLAEMLSLPGNSGSPVFVYRMSYGAVLGAPEGVSDPCLLGIDFCHLANLKPVVLRDGETRYQDATGKRLYINQNSGMMGIIPAWHLTELLQSEPFNEMRGGTAS